MKKILNEEGIEHQISTAYTPEQNGKAEREMRTMTEAARTMLIAKNLPKYLRAEAINTAAHVINRTGNSQDQDKSPYEVWFGNDIKIRYLKIF